MKKINYILLSCCSGLLLINTAMAGTVSNIVQKSADLVFSSSTDVSISIVPTQGLQAGSTASGTVIATAAINAGTGNQLAFNWEPTSGTVGTNHQDIVITGKNNSQDTLSVELVQTDPDGYVFNQQGAWLLVDTSGGQPASSDNLNIVTNGAQTVNADTYTLSLQAGIWTQ